jgi:hypothetical protein
MGTKSLFYKEGKWGEWRFYRVQKSWEEGFLQTTDLEEGFV